MKIFLSLAFAVAASATPSEFRAVLGGERFIIGGQDAELGELPYQLSLQFKGRHSCGASLVEPGLAVTAAHCVDGKSEYEIQLVAGTVNISTYRGQSREVERIVVHRDYDSQTLQNDIALLFLWEGFSPDRFVDTIPIPREYSPTSGDLLVSGWGVTLIGGRVSDVLKKVVVPFVSDASCRDSYSEERILDSMLCAGLPEGGKDSCQGDSGGPLVSLETGNLVGIVSWGIGCARPNLPGVYTEVAYFTNWIKEQKTLH